MLTLYFNWNAVCALKVVLCLQEKGLDFSERHIDLTRFEQLEEWYLRLNPAGVVPTLVHDGHIVLESTIIAEYLEDAFPDAPLRPKSPLALSRMRWWARQVDEVVHPSLRPLGFTRFATAKARSLSGEELEALRSRMPKEELGELWWRVAQSPYSSEELARCLYKVQKILARMEASLSREPWLAGGELSLADLAFVPYFRRMAQLDKTALWRDLPGVSAWLARLQDRASYAALEKLQQRYGGEQAPP